MCRLTCNKRVCCSCVCLSRARVSSRQQDAHTFLLTSIILMALISRTQTVTVPIHNRMGLLQSVGQATTSNPNTGVDYVTLFIIVVAVAIVVLAIICVL